MVKANHAEDRLRFTTDAAMGIAHGEVVFIAVGTPPDGDGSADLQYVLAVATIGRNLQRPTVVVDKSTVPVGTADRRVRAASPRTASARRRRAVRVVSRSSPRKARRSGTACADRIVIGADSARGGRLAPVRAVQPQRATVFVVMDDAFGGTDQVRGERDARDQDQLHEQDREHRRAGRRRRRERAQGIGSGSAHRLALHLSGRRLRRFLQKGRAGAGRDRAAIRRAAAPCWTRWKR